MTVKSLSAAETAIFCPPPASAAKAANPTRLARYGSAQYSPEELILERKPSELMRTYIENRAKLSVISSKTKGSGVGRDREEQGAQRLGYNLVGP